MHCSLKTIAWAILLGIIASCAQETINVEALSPGKSLYASLAEGPGNQDASRLYLPFLANSLLSLQGAPIWAHHSTPASHEVVMFRRTFDLESPAEDVELVLFADTRYQAWFDGAWLGQGPARFSRSRQEEDHYPLGDLAAGQHILSVLVQWAPNIRRSESARPLLQSRLLGKQGGSPRVLARSGPDWQAQLSPAWQKNAAPVHAWGLIGPTELLDLRLLSADWNQLGGTDNGWIQAVIVDPSEVFFRPLRLLRIEPEKALTQLAPEFSPLDFQALEAVQTVTRQGRSIPFLSRTPVALKVMDAGLLSPGGRIGELPPSQPMPFTVHLTATLPATLTLSMLDAYPGVSLDSAPFHLARAATERPDIYTTTLSLQPGQHFLTFSQNHPYGAPFALQATNLEISELPFGQGVHAGRRLLLAEMSHLPDAVNIITTTHTLTVSFPAQPAYLVLDLGRTVYGRILANATGAAGTVIDIGWDERLLAGTSRPLPHPGSLHPQWNEADSWVLDGSRRELTTIDQRAGRYVMIAVWGEQPVQFDSLQVIEERYPVELEGSFQSSDPLLDRIWQVGADSAAVNMLDAYADPWRERGQWWGDAYVIDHANRAAFGDTGLLKRGILFMADAITDQAAPGIAPNPQGTNMLDYAMLWLHSLAEYHQLTSDTAFAKARFPAVKKLMSLLASYENKSTGLLDLPRTSWGLTAYIDPRGESSRYGQSAALNALYFSALSQASNLADLLGEPAQAESWREKAGKLQINLDHYLLIPEQHRYKSNLYQGVAAPPTPHAQAWPLAYGLVSREEQPKVTAALLELLPDDPERPTLDIYGMFWVLEALGKNGQVAAGLQIIRTYYGHLLEKGATTWWERFDADQLYPASLSHGWGSAPTWFLTTYVLGASRTGKDSWQLAPPLESLSFAAGSLPLGSGALQARWERPSCSQANLTFAAPPGSQGEVHLPYSGITMQVKLDDEIIWEDGEALVEGIVLNNAKLVFSSGEGAHTVLIQQACNTLYAPMITR